MSAMTETFRAIPEVHYENLPTDRLGEVVWSASRSVYQIETLETYGVPHEDGAFRSFLQGRTPSSEDVAAYQSWFDKVRDAVTRQVNVTRIHLLPDTIGDYLRYEIEYGYRQWCLPYGEKVLLLKKSEHPSLARLAFRDFYVIDDARVITPEYTADNRYVGLTEVVNQPAINFFVQLKYELQKVGRRLLPTGPI